jgi:hypothetical protein
MPTDRGKIPSMRKQYHPLPSSKGLLVWDVDRLVKLAEGLRTEWVRLEDIWELDRVRWFDEEEPPTCRAILAKRFSPDPDPDYVGVSLNVLPY